MTDNQRDTLLVEMHTDIKHLRNGFENHLEHHFKYSFFAWTTAVGLIIALCVVIVKTI